MNLTRPVAFWIAVLAAVVVAVVLLREVLLPFVAGMLLAYLLDPLATRLERLGMNRLIATLTIVGLFVVGVTALIILTAPVVVGEIAYFIDNFPLYIKRVQGLATDPNRPWLSKLVGRPSLRRAVGRGTNHIGDYLAPRFSAFGLDRRPGADLGLLPPGGDPDRCLLSHL
jgi:predicted PurR-regulated permease PerM